MQSFMASFDKNETYMSGFQGIPPSILGFVCKPDMPPHINILFRARQPLGFVEKPQKGESRPYDGILSMGKDILSKFEESSTKRIPEESKKRNNLLSIIENTEKNKIENKEKIKEWHPNNDPNIQGDPYKTLFIYKLDFKTDEKKLKREFEMYGPIKKVKIIRDQNGKSRGYAFIEFEHKSDFKNAYKRAERKRVGDSKVMVDYERGRTEKNWKPRRFGGGKGDSRAYPVWLEKELKEMKELFPELLTKFKKIEEFADNNDKIPNRENSQDKNAKRKEKDEMQCENQFQTIERVEDINSQNVITTNHVESKTTNGGNNIKFGNNVSEDDQTVKGEDEKIKEKNRKKEKKDRKEKKEKKDKKHRKDKKEKKEKKERKEKKNRKVSDGELGELRELGEIIEK